MSRAAETPAAALQVMNAQQAGASAAVIINEDDEELESPSFMQSGAQAQVPSARISHSSGRAVAERTQREPALTVTLAVPEGTDICQEQHVSCGQEAQESSQGRRDSGVGVEIVLTPQVLHPCMQSAHGNAWQHSCGPCRNVHIKCQLGCDTAQQPDVHDHILLCRQLSG